MIDAKMQNTIAELRRLPWLDFAKLDKLVGDCEELERRLSVEREKLLALRPSSKDYNEQLSKLSTVCAALESQYDLALEDLEAEVRRLKREAVERADLSNLAGKAAALDREALSALRTAHRALTERHFVTERHNETVDLLANWAHELRLNNPPRRLETAWKSAWPSWPGVFGQYFTRFLSMTDAGAPPEEGLYEWFTRRVW